MHLMQFLCDLLSCGWRVLAASRPGAALRDGFCLSLLCGADFVADAFFTAAFVAVFFVAMSLLPVYG